MGHPKKQKKKYENPFRPWNKSRIESERKILNEFGLRRKKEIRRAESTLRGFRQRARNLLAAHDVKKEKELFDKLNGMGMRCTKLDDVLSIRLENLLARRLQTIVYKKGIANTPRQARQLIVHGHVIVSNRKIVWPSYIVMGGEEDTISLKPGIAARMVKQVNK